MALSPLACPFSIGKNCLFACNLPVSAQLQHPSNTGTQVLPRVEASGVGWEGARQCRCGGSVRFQVGRQVSWVNLVECCRACWCRLVNSVGGCIAVLLKVRGVCFCVPAPETIIAEWSSSGGAALKAEWRTQVNTEWVLWSWPQEGCSFRGFWLCSPGGNTLASPKKGIRQTRTGVGLAFGPGVLAPNP